MSIDPKTLLEKALSFNDKLEQNRRELHRNAETGFDIPITLEFVRSELDMAGVKWDNCGRAGITAVIGGKRSGKTFMLRADMDGLPVKEESGEIFHRRTAICTPAVTICTPPCCWGLPVC